MLSTLLLADSVSKGGPGSGPQKTYQESATHAQELSRKAMVSNSSKIAHLNARNAHITAMKLAPTSWQSEFHERNAREHQAYARTSTK